MPSAPTLRGELGERVSDTSVAISPTAAITVDKIACLSAITDNAPTSDGPSTQHAVTDTDGHVWTKVFEETETDGAADDGCTISLWMTKVTSEIGTGDAVTLTLDDARLSKVVRIWEFAVTAGNTFAFETPAIDHAGTGATLASLPNREYLWVGMFGGEGEDLLGTEDTDYTTLGVTTSSLTGAVDTNVTLLTATRIATLTGDTYNPTGYNWTNAMKSLVAVYEVAAGPPPAPLDVKVFSSRRIRVR